MKKQARDSNGRFLTKGIAESVASVGASKEAQSESVVGRNATYKTLSPRQAYENNIHARKAVSAIVDQLVKASRRLFSRNSNAEILSGDAYDFVRKSITAHFTRALFSWWNLEGEMAVWKQFSIASIRPNGLRVLDPGYLIPQPYNVRDLEFVTTWRYLDGRALDNKTPAIDLPVAQVAFEKNWNPNSPLRGSSPAVTGAQEISTNYYANRFNSSFFQNGTVGDVLFRFPKGTKKELAKDYVDRWQAQHGIFNNNGFRAMAVIGDEMDVEYPQTTAKDGQFLQLTGHNEESIGGLWGVPPSVMGFLSKTRFDTIDVELESFFENTLLPQLTIGSEFIQKQIIDPHFSGGSRNTRKDSPRLGKHLKKSMERAYDENPESDLIFLFDADSLPIMAKLRLQQLSSADQYRKTMGVSFAVAAEWAGVDRPSNEADDLIYIDSTLQLVNPVKAVEATGHDPLDQPEEVGDEPKQPSAQDKPEEAETTGQREDQAKRLKALESFARAYRSLVCENAEKAIVYRKTDVLKLLEGIASPAAQVQVHKDFLQLRNLIKEQPDQSERLRSVKNYFNATWKKSAMKQLL